VAGKDWPDGEGRVLTRSLTGAVGRLVLGFAVVTAGCASGPPFQAAAPKPEAALLYLYRPSSIVGGGNHYIVAVNGKAVARLSSGSYFALDQAPGQVVVSRQAASALGWGPGSIVGALEGFVETDRFEAKNGQRYFVTFPAGKLVASEAEALREMSGLEPSPPLK
jgi:hypothetical protein